MSDPVAMHDQRLSAYRAMGTRERTRRDAKAAKPNTAGVENTTPDRRASFRHAQGLDGSDAFPHQNIAAREYRDEFACSGIQSEASDANHRNRPAHEGNQRLDSALRGIQIQTLIFQNPRSGHADTPRHRVFTQVRRETGKE